MFDAEQLLGKILKQSLGSGSGQGVLDSIGAGSGLLTMIGLGVGAYEILSEKNKAGQAAPVPPPPPGSGMATPPPPPPPAASSVPPPPVQTGEREQPAELQIPPNPHPGGPGQQGDESCVNPARTAPGFHKKELALRLIRVMISAANADGHLDESEERAILDRLRGAGLSEEEKLFLLDELHRPRPIEELTRDITDPGTAKTMYLLAAGTIEIDTDQERQWLDALGEQLGLSQAVRSFIEEQAQGIRQNR